jgi:pimeloyl-ACP methyl ester carboxylesterase
MALRFRRLAERLPSALPLAVREHRYPGPARELIVFLPGVFDVIEDYEAHGFLHAVRQTGRAVDLLLVDAHFGYYASGTVLERLRRDVIEPARVRYESIRLAGISMGGLGALLYGARYPGHVTDLALLAPFVGEPPIIADIAGAGGVRSWSPTVMPEPEYQHELWQWLKQYDPARSGCPRIVLGYGLRDKAVPGLGLLADILPREHVFTARGRHDWRTWRRLWHAMLPTFLPVSEPR